MQYENIFTHTHKFVILMNYNIEVRSLINVQFLNYHLQISVHLRILGSHSGVAGYSGLPACDTVTMEEWSSAF